MRTLFLLLTSSLLGCWRTTTPQTPPTPIEPKKEATPKPDPQISLLSPEQASQEAPTELVSLEESSKSAPSWAPPYPVAGNVGSWFAQAQPLTGLLEKDLFLCRFQAPAQIFRGQKIARAEDTRLHVVMTLPNGKKLSSPYGEKGYVSYAMLPLFDLKPGEKLKLEFYDSGFVGGLLGLFMETEVVSERLGSMTLSYTGGLPMIQTIKSSGFTQEDDSVLSAECRGYDRAAVEAKIPEALARLDKNFLVDPERPFGRNLPQTQGVDAGYHRSTTRQMEVALLDVVALLGWADPRVKGRAEVIAQQRAQWDNKVQEILPKPGTPITLERNKLEAKIISITPKKNKKAKLQVTVELRATSQDQELFRNYTDLVAYLEDRGSYQTANLSTVDGKPFKEDTQLPRDQATHTLVFESEVAQSKIFCLTGTAKEDCAAFWIYEETRVP